MKLFDGKIIITALVIASVLLSMKVSSNDSRLIGDSNVSTSLGNTAAIESPADLNVQAALVLDLKNKNILFKLNETKRWPMASLTKLVTAVVSEKLMPANEVVNISSEAIAAEGNSGNFSAGEKYELGDLVKAMLLVSSNDAAKAIALHYGEGRFVQIMNAEAKDLKMFDASFEDSSGLSAQNLGTAQDLGQLINFVFYERPDLLNITREKSGFITEARTHTARELMNINRFAGREDFWGGKTGTMPEVGGNLVSVFNMNGPKAIIVLGANDKFGETEKIIDKLWPKKQ